MPSTTRRRVLASVGGLLGLSGSGERQPQTTGTTGHEENTHQSRATRQTQTTYPPQTDRPGWVGLEVENNDGVAHEVRVRVTSDARTGTSDARTGTSDARTGTTDGEKDTSDPEELFARTLTLRPQSEPEFNSVVPIPEFGDRRVRVAAGLASADSADATEGTESADNEDGRSASATFTVSANSEYQRLFVTIDRNGVLQLTQGTEPSEPIRTTTSK